MVERDEIYIDLLLNYLHKFWDLAKAHEEPVWHADIFDLKLKSKEISLKSNCIYSTSKSLITPQVLSHPDLNKFMDTTPLTKSKQNRKCQGCRDEEWKCKINPCEVRRKRLNNQMRSKSSSYQSYKYGSNAVHNSCHQDTFLELTYHSFKRRFNWSSDKDIGEGLIHLINAFLLREKGNFMTVK